MTTILGIETSCDETAAAVVRGSSTNGKGEILSNVVHSQIDDHAIYGGVVPEIAARAHVEKLDSIIRAAMTHSGCGWDDIDAIAATSGPGLIGGLIVGVMTAKAIALSRAKPFVAINHLEGHALTPRLTDGISYPYLMLLVSGGHTQIVKIDGLNRYERYATTIDDALGEAFDKTAKLLGLPYPGGPAVEAMALKGDAKRFDLPRPLRGEERPDFSYSGLKTALRQRAQSLGNLTEIDIADLCASFQLAVTETLKERISVSLNRYRNETPGEKHHLVVAGGVAANKAIRAALEELCAVNNFELIAAPAHLCTDNAAMIAWAGLEHFEAGQTDDFTVSPRPRWPLDPSSDALLGGGKKGAKA